MPTIGVNRDILFDYIGQKFSKLVQLHLLDLTMMKAQLTKLNLFQSSRCAVRWLVLRVWHRIGRCGCGKSWAAQWAQEVHRGHYVQDRDTGQQIWSFMRRRPWQSSLHLLAKVGTVWTCLDDWFEWMVVKLLLFTQGAHILPSSSRSPRQTPSSRWPFFLMWVEMLTRRWND